MITKLTLGTSVATAACVSAMAISAPALAQTAPLTYNSCVGPANGNIVAVNPRSCVSAVTLGGARASIINGHVDAPNTTAGTATSWSDNGWTNSASATNISTAVGSASLADGTVKASVSNPNDPFAQGFVLSTISDIVTFNNTSGAAINLRVGYSFDGQYINGQNNYSDYTSIYLALTAPERLITFANSGQNVGGYGLSRGWADGFFDQQWFFAGQAQDFDITSFGSPSGGVFGGGISTLLSIPTGVSQLGFTLSLDLGCRVSGSTCDFGNTSAFKFGALPTGLSFTSQSGTLFSANAAPPPGGVPEPATWAMMILGFGTIGASMRRRKAAHVSFV